MTEELNREEEEEDDTIYSPTELVISLLKYFINIKIFVLIREERRERRDNCLFIQPTGLKATSRDSLITTLSRLQLTVLLP